jgi:hypothetical protein
LLVFTNAANAQHSLERKTESHGQTGSR